MSRTITIDPVTRIEGHARVLLDLADDESVRSARLVVNELRGFERMLVGMEADRMPLVTARICGVCPVPHALASTKALESAFGIQPAPGGLVMRRLISLGHVIHSHGLHLFALGGPDLFFGLAADPAVRNVVGLVEAAPDLAGQAMRLRTLGQKLVEAVGGRGIHPVTVVLGGVSFTLSEAELASLRKLADELVAVAGKVVPAFRGLLERLLEAEPPLRQAAVPSLDLGLLRGGRLDHYDGALTLGATDGARLGEIPADRYADFLEERSFDWSYMKPTWVRWGGAESTYRVGPLARVNLVEAIDTPLAAAELAAFRAAGAGRPSQLMVMQHWARLVEVLWACEEAQRLLADPALRGPSRVAATIRAGRGVGVVEAPRGSLIHEYEVDAKGIVRRANLIIATQQNYHGINSSLEQAADAYVAGKGDAAVLNAVEFAIRCWDPCLSCATHAVGRMPIELEVRRGGQVVRTVRRGS